MPPTLTPFVRSDAVGAILAEVFAEPTQELTIAEVARRADVLPAVAHREIGRLVSGGVLTDRREGNNRLVRVNLDHPLYRPMAEIVAAAYGPVPVLRSLLEAKPGVEAAYIYGSWAARRAGEPGPPPRDIDVVVIGSLGLDEMIQIQEAARDQLRIDVNIHRVDQSSWDHPDGNPFLTTVTSRPLVQIVGRKYAHA